MGEGAIKKSQLISISDGERIEINAVDSVISFDDEGIVIMTSLGKISIEGDELRIVELNKEKRYIEIEGAISGVFYIDRHWKKKRGLFG